VGNIICRFGPPTTIVSDRGPNFIGGVMKEVNRLLEIDNRKTSAYHPQTNGITERFNKTLCEMLSMYVGKHQRDWDEFIPYVAYAYRTAVHASTNQMPFMMVYGRQPTLPGDILVRVEQNEHNNTTEYVQQLTKRLKIVFKEVEYFENIIKQKREQSYHKNKQNHTFQLGDLVWVYDHKIREGLVSKLRRPWVGPYKIIDLPTAVNAKIQHMNGKVIKTLVHVNRLKKYETPQRPPIPEFTEEELIQMGI